jgi:hypothetical protein
MRGGPSGYAAAVSGSPEPDPAPPTADPAGNRTHLVRAGLSGAAAVLLVAAAVLAIALGYVFFTVALVVMAVFAGVEASWKLRRWHRSR